MFLLLVCLCAITMVAWVTRPLWRGQVDSGQARRAANVAAYRQRITELDADLSAGLLDSKTHVALRSELDARLVTDTDAGVDPGNNSGRGVILPVLLAVLIPAFAIFGYVWSGTWEVDQQIATAEDASPPTRQEIEQLVDALAQRMENEPDKLDGWALLARSSFSLGRYEAAAEAYRKANELSQGREPAYLVGEGESLAMARNRKLEGRPRQLFQNALAIEPDHSRALWFAALAAEQAGQMGEARRLWQRLARQDVPQNVRMALEERLGQTTRTDQDAVASDFEIQVTVDLGNEIANKLPADTTVFVFARAAEGPPMPLAAHRTTLADLPETIRLNDSMAMMPNMKLSAFDRWVLTARVSVSGQAEAQSGDLQGSLTVARADLGDAALHVTIDQVVP